MEKRRTFFIALLGFLLPGLGHLYIGRTLRALSLFTAFTILIIYPKFVILALFVVFYSALEALRLSINYSDSSNKVRKFIYSAVGILAFTFWMTLLAPIELKNESQKLPPQVLRIK